MSLFLLPEQEYFQAMNSSIPHKQVHVQLQKKKAKDFVLKESFNSKLWDSSQQIWGKIISQNYQHHMLMMCDISYKLRGLFSMKSSKKKLLYSLHVEIIGEDENYYKVNNIFQTTQICRYFIRQHARFNNALFLIKLNPSNRQVKIQLPLYLSQTWPFRTSPFKTNSNVKFLLRSMIKPHLAWIQLSLKHILKQEGRQGHRFIFQNQNKTIQTLKKYCSISYLASPTQSQHRIESQFFPMKHKQSINKIMAYRQTQNYQLIKNNSLYIDLIMPQREIFQNSALQQMLLNEQKNLKAKIIFPIVPQSHEPQENYMVYNKIKLNQIKQNESIKINRGGFSDIYLTQITFWYPFLSDMKTPNPLGQTNLFTERIVIKRELPRNQIFEEVKQSIYESRKYHEYKILQKLKKAKSIFIPRYYFPINKKTQSNILIDNFLLLQYLPSKTLNQLLQSNFKCLSLHTRLKLMYALCQGLRYLRDFNIVHLDVKPNNILTYHNSYIKLIDFGQSYHPEVCMKDYAPGFTIPYSPPEIFDGNEIISSKSDVFSMGTVFYQILFNKFPFSFYTNTTEYYKYLKSRLQWSWYYSPQEQQSYGQIQVLRILVNLIARCSSFIAENRPELDWIAIIIRHLLDLVP